jgi:hypothetical protein
MFKNKKLNIVLFGTALLIACVGATDAIMRPEARITFIVKDDFGKPLPDMVVGMSTFHHWVPGGEWGTDITKDYEGKTDVNGMVTLSGSGINFVFDYYVLNGKTHYNIGRQRYIFKEKKNGRWEPWNPTVEIVCKPVIKPIAMYWGGGEIEFPEKEKEFGFDLKRKDWIAPYGNGLQTDMIFKLEDDDGKESQAGKIFFTELRVNGTKTLNREY